MDDFLFFSFKFIYFIVYFIFGRVGSSLLRAGFSLVGERGATLCGARASHCGGFSCCRARALGARASVVVAHRLHGMWVLPGPGLKPVSPALAGGFLTTAPPGKPQCDFLPDLTMGFGYPYLIL